jgi:hypothetical protein
MSATPDVDLHFHLEEIGSSHRAIRYLTIESDEGLKFSHASEGRPYMTPSIVPPSSAVPS